MAATERTIPKTDVSVPKTDASLAGSGFGATLPPPRARPMSSDFRGDSGEMCELLHTSLVRPKNDGRARGDPCPWPARHGRLVGE